MTKTSTAHQIETTHAAMIAQQNIAHDPTIDASTRELAARLAAKLAAKNIERIYGTEEPATDHVARLTAARDSLIATANEPAIPLIRERSLRLARYLTTQIAELTDAKPCGVCQLDIATQTVRVLADDVHACLTCGTALSAFLA